MAKGTQLKGRGGGGSGATRALIGLMILPIGYLLLPTVVLLFFGMLPTWVALVIGRGSSHRYSWICVGGLNFAGITPSLLNLWFQGQTIERAVDTLTNVFSLMVMYGSAGFGWLIYMAMPPVVGMFLDVTTQHRVNALKAQQRKLRQTWGPEVAQAAGSDDSSAQSETEPQPQPQPKPNGR